MAHKDQWADIQWLLHCINITMMLQCSILSYPHHDGHLASSLLKHDGQDKVIQQRSRQHVTDRTPDRTCVQAVHNVYSIHLHPDAAVQSTWTG